MSLGGVRQIKEKHEDWLLSLPGVVGVGIGKSPSGELCIRVYIKRGMASSSDRIPNKLDGVGVIAQEVGDIVAYEL